MLWPAIAWTAVVVAVLVALLAAGVLVGLRTGWIES